MSAPIFMPTAISNERLVGLEIEDDSTPYERHVIYAAHRRDRALGPGGRWLLDRLRERLRVA